VPASPLSAEGRLRRAGAALWGTSFRDEGKHGEPQDREQGETHLHGRGGANRRGGEKPRGRNARRTGCLPPKGSAETRGLGDGLHDSERWRGDLWTTPGEDVRLDQAGPHGSRRDGKVGVKVRRVSHSHFRVLLHPGRKDLEGPGAKSVEGRGGERRSQAPRNRSGNSPRGWPPDDGGGRRESVPPRASAAVERSGVACHVRGPSVWGVGPAERPASTLKTRRTTYPPARNLEAALKGAAEGRPGSREPSGPPIDPQRKPLQGIRHRARCVGECNVRKRT